ncbi:DNA-binding transcriptional repressor DeoR [Mangrovibacter plantisponsor]|uniref:DeoR family transcriptional regulator n=1 Tax=Mangrovibacter plantisponsor TaxID=451513 RepID=A0A317Q348_9ENTR|nr:DNA-binding transcriptional repressor DeoR [Mangrovibacter plantisponsor]PWW10251.1 DeoR family transcriptional regulator [Mangrovibacter plantisponsor]
METRHDERVQQLLLAIKRSDKLHLKDAARLLGVSEMTIRRDINTTDAPVSLLGGYLVIEAHAANASNYLLSVQKHRLVKEKQFIGRLAAKLVKPHHTVFFDCGTTTPWVIDAIPDDLPFTGICYSLNTFLSLQEKPMCQVILCGGEFHHENAVFTPVTFQETLDHLRPDLAFFSAAGVSPQKGITCFNINELPVKHWAMKAASRHILVADHSKFGVVRGVFMGELSAFDSLVTDKAPSEAELTALLTSAITVICEE